MARQHLQARLAGLGRLPIRLLHSQHLVPRYYARGAKEVRQMQFICTG